MREIKFRTWDKDTAKYTNGVDEPHIDIFAAGIKTYCIGQMCPGRYIIEQYTGLKDKNGKEIYEGDILGGIWECGYIAWCDKCKQFQYHISTNECMACLGDVHWYELVEDDGKLEVIGNIHENPELVEEE